MALTTTMIVHDRQGSAAPQATRVLLLGGTLEARLLAQRIAAEQRLEGIVSLAGRTSAPLSQELPVRIGGFGGVEGLMRYLATERVDKVIDATHPFAAQMAENAREACAALGKPLLKLSRAPWEAVGGDRWTAADDQACAAMALGAAPRRVFLTTGRMGLSNFLAAPQHHYFIRTIEPPEVRDLPPQCDVILERGPFDCESEMELMHARRIDALVTKNSGGDSTYAKIEAARRLGVEVVMIARPQSRGVRLAHEIESAMSFLLEGAS
jgi:precorrin-6A/cobalt-precorrin-6A reductase